jgi:hypothetical protein
MLWMEMIKVFQTAFKKEEEGAEPGTGLILIPLLLLFGLLLSFLAFPWN